MGKYEYRSRDGRDLVCTLPQTEAIAESRRARPDVLRLCNYNNSELMYTIDCQGLPKGYLKRSSHKWRFLTSSLFS